MVDYWVGFILGVCFSILIGLLFLNLVSEDTIEYDCIKNNQIKIGMHIYECKYSRSVAK